MPDCARYVAFLRGDESWSDLAALPGERVVAVQLNDGTRVPENPDYFEDNMVNRRSPGEGEFDLVRFVRTLDQIGSPGTTRGRGHLRRVAVTDLRSCCSLGRRHAGPAGAGGSGDGKPADGPESNGADS